MLSVTKQDLAGPYDVYFVVAVDIRGQKLDLDFASRHAAERSMVNLRGNQSWVYLSLVGNTHKAPYRSNTLNVLSRKANGCWEEKINVAPDGNVVRDLDGFYSQVA